MIWYQSRYQFITNLLFGGLMVIGISLVNGCKKPESNSISLAVVNAKMWTGNRNQPYAEAMAISGKEIAAVGGNSEIRQRIQKSTRVIDVAGAMVIPGFIDSHIHFIEGGLRLASVQLRDARTPKEFSARIQEYVKTLEPGVWITGGDWDHEQWGGELPTCHWIDEHTPNNPVWVNRLDGHMALANSAAMAVAQITRDTPNVPGGTIVRNRDGKATGIFKENAMFLIEKYVPEPKDSMKDLALAAAMDYVAAQGVTSVQHMGSWDDLAVFERAHKAGKLYTRISAAVPIATWEKLSAKIVTDGHGDRWLRIGSLKGYVDGSLGSKTAAFLEPYPDSSNDSGLIVTSPKALYEWIATADKLELQPIIHAIGDRANRIILDIYQRVIKENGKKERRFRVEHAQHLTPQDIPRFKALNVIASMQPYHTIDDGRWAEKVIGAERLQTTYAFRSLLDAGVHLIFGSDWYVAPPTPLEGIYAAVSRRTLDDKYPDGWVPQQKISVEEALRAYTIDAAYASFEEKIKGSLESGKLADFVVIDRDLTQIPAHEIRNARILLTVVDGKIVYESKGDSTHTGELFSIQ